MRLTSIDSAFRELERLTQPVFGGAWTPMPMDAVRRDDEVLLRFDLPGIDPDSIEVTVDGGVLSVSARREDACTEDEGVFVHERSTGAFTRQVYLPEHLDADGVQAAYDNGVLTVRVPVLEATQPHKVEIAKGDAARALTK
ncbi:Hsp20/alpha crystallin family protein [Nonomuraea sp. KC401]|uniref:Hsp20/alpha crystallin family protein n=1 Tax=unclassified Nonomuraea TaxID=2593643 RepID=UPI0010FEF6F2|nr:MULTISPECIES: Hsp20/alpha crystallin family protein [unclassified Nonomuraea]NBE93411.1 Hsp20 family protein [Nonomuraea sp. K271]TLF74968.1 Hsp20/alpha crystallin family protein [Nonomuraea sp. KC401]